jgi:hypothetical protein
MYRGTRFGLAAAVAVVSNLSGCFLFPTLVEPVTLENPAPQRQLWAVAPFTNESGVSVVDPYRVADQFVYQLEEVARIDTVPLNRVIHAMRELGIDAVTSPHEARSIMFALGSDALVVGTITAWDPYPPPTVGAAVQLYESRFNRQASLDVQDLVRSPSGDVAMTELSPDHPAAQAAGVFDARNHGTLAALAEYSSGRTLPDSAFGADAYLMSMELYTQFVSYRLIHDLLEDLRIRQTPVAIDGPER